MPIVGGGTAWWSFLHIDDAAEATALAVERGRGLYNIVDDDPAQVRDWLAETATMLGAKPPLRLPAWLAPSRRAGAPEVARRPSFNDMLESLDREALAPPLVKAADLTPPSFRQASRSRFLRNAP